MRGGRISCAAVDSTITWRRFRHAMSLVLWRGPFKALDSGIEGVMNFPMDGLDRIFIVLLTLMAPHS